jgi:MFS family permease
VSAAHSEPPAQGLATYRRVLTRPRVLPLAAASVLARMSTGMGSVALILYVHGISGSFGAAGVVAGAFTIGIGITGPLLGRLIDRRGSRRVLVPGGLLAGAGFLAVVALGEGGAGTVALAAAAFLAGAATPPVGGVLRQRWPDVVAPADLTTAYACDAILIEVIFIAGPLLAGLLAATAGADVGVLAAGGLSALGSVLFARLATVAPAPAGEPRHWLGAIASARLRLLVFAGVPVGASFGALDVALPAFGAHHGAAALGGPYTAAFAVGSMLGGIAYGARHDALGPPARALLILGALTSLLCMPVLAAATIAEMFFCAALSGLCVAPLITVRNQLLRSSAPAGTETEAFTWLSLSITLGASVGAALAGPLAEAAGWRAAAALACVLPALATAVLASRYHLLGEGPPRVSASDPAIGG